MTCQPNEGVRIPSFRFIRPPAAAGTAHFYGVCEVRMDCFSLDFCGAPVEERRLFALSSRERAALYERLGPLGSCVVLVTCNRTELYFSCSPEAARNALFEAAGVTRPLAYHAGEAAERHLFLLAAGLCSMLLGEDEILGQLRDAYEEACAFGATAGLDAVFQAALACGKRVRAQTKISSHACSVATLAANAVRGARAKNVLMIGATGKLGASVLKNLLTADGLHIWATVREHRISAAAAGSGVVCVPYAERYVRLNEADAVICCTASQHTVLEYAPAAAALKTPRRRLLIDLAVPPDIDGAMAELPGCTLMNIDEFRAAAEENNQKKRAAVVEARRVAETCFTEYRAAKTARRFAERLARDGALRSLRKRDPAAFIAACARPEEEKS